MTLIGEACCRLTQVLENHILMGEQFSMTTQMNLNLVAVIGMIQ